MSTEAFGRERLVDAGLECPEGSCELLAGHEGPHLAIFDVAGLEDADPRQIWQKWETGEPRALFRVFLCDEWDSYPPAAGDDEQHPCVLPEGHVGPHRALPGWWWAN
jgi:hypothetical protein